MQRNQICSKILFLGNIIHAIHVTEETLYPLRLDSEMTSRPVFLLKSASLCISASKTQSVALQRSSRVLIDPEKIIQRMGAIMNRMHDCLCT